MGDGQLPGPFARLGALFSVLFLVQGDTHGLLADPAGTDTGQAMSGCDSIVRAGQAPYLRRRCAS